MMLPTRGRLLIYGYGNPARGDDGLGPAAASALESRSWTRVRVESNYQLELEDVALLTEFDRAVFVDADISGPEPFGFKPVRPASRVGWTSHAMTPATLVYLTGRLFSHDVEAYTLGIRGYEFDRFADRLSGRARQNLQLALEFLTQQLVPRFIRDEDHKGEGTGSDPCQGSGLSTPSCSAGASEGPSLRLAQSTTPRSQEHHRGCPEPVGSIEPETPSASIQANRGRTPRGAARRIGAKG